MRFAILSSAPDWKTNEVRLSCHHSGVGEKRVMKGSSQSVAVTRLQKLEENFGSMKRAKFRHCGKYA